jgi:hypothetical protein
VKHVAQAWKAVFEKKFGIDEKHLREHAFDEATRVQKKCHTL